MNSRNDCNSEEELTKSEKKTHPTRTTNKDTRDLCVIRSRNEKIWVLVLVSNNDNNVTIRNVYKKKFSPADDSEGYSIERETKP